MKVWTGTVLAAALLFGTTACGGNHDTKKAADNNQAATEFGNLKPEDVRAAPAEVADGLRALDGTVDEIVAKLGVDDQGAVDAQERLLPIWESILGTVKANDAAAYQKLDTALNLLMTVKKDNKTGAQQAADTVHATGDDYLKRFPATASAAPQASASPSTSGVPVGSDTGPGLGY